MSSGDRGGPSSVALASGSACRAAGAGHGGGGKRFYNRVLSRVL